MPDRGSVRNLTLASRTNSSADFRSIRAKERVALDKAIGEFDISASRKEPMLPASLGRQPAEAPLAKMMMTDPSILSSTSRQWHDSGTKEQIYKLHSCTRRARAIDHVISSEMRNGSAFGPHHRHALLGGCRRRLQASTDENRGRRAWRTGVK